MDLYKVGEDEEYSVTADLIEGWKFSRAEVAKILAMEDGGLSTWLKRYSPFPEQRQGKGRHLTFGLSEVLKLAVMQQLVRMGLPPSAAALALRQPIDPYRELLTRGRDLLGHRVSAFPGTVTFSMNSSGQWGLMPDPRHQTSLNVHLWPIFDDLWPRVREAINESPGQMTLEEITRALSDYQQHITEIRARLWSRTGSKTETEE